MAKSSKKSKTLSAGVIVYDGNKFIIGHATGGRHWDIPKGKIEPNEVAIAGAIRELEEETGLKAPFKELVHLGIFQYKRDKDLSLYLWHVKTHFDLTDLICTSTFVNQQGKTLPELDKFMYVTFEQVYKKTVPAMKKVLEDVEVYLRFIKR